MWSELVVQIDNGQVSLDWQTQWSEWTKHNEF